MKFTAYNLWCFAFLLFLFDLVPSVFAQRLREGPYSGSDGRLRVDFMLSNLGSEMAYVSFYHDGISQTTENATFAPGQERICTHIRIGSIGVVRVKRNENFIQVFLFVVTETLAGKTEVVASKSSE